MHAAVALNTNLRSELLQGLCLFTVAAYRSSEKRPDAARAAEIVHLVKERLQQSIAEVIFWASRLNGTRSKDKAVLFYCRTDSSARK